MTTTTLKKKRATLHSRSLWDGPAVKKWNWPLQVGTLEANTLATKQVFGQRWVKQYTDTQKLSQGFKKPDILYLDSMYEVEVLFSKDPGWVSASIVLINLGNIRTLFARLDVVAKHIKKVTGATGVFFLNTKRALNTWYENFVINLSHNNGVDEAIKKVKGISSKGFVTRALNEEARLSRVVKDLIRQIEKNPYPTRAKVDVALGPNRFEKMTLTNAAKYLYENFDKLFYDYEKGTAGTVKKSFQALSNAASKGKKRKLYALRPPTSRFVTRAKKKALARKPLRRSGLKGGIGQPRISSLGESAEGLLRRKAAKKAAALKPAKRFAKKKGAPKKKVAKKKAAGKAVKKLARKKGSRKITIRGGSIGGNPWPPAPKKAASPKKKIDRKAADLDYLVEKNLDKKRKVQKTKQPPRYLHAAFRKPRERQAAREFLEPNSPYHLYIKIGEEDIMFLRASAEMDTRAEFLDESVQEIPIDLLVTIGKEKEIKKTIMLPREGDSEMALFHVKTPNKAGKLKTVIRAYHKDRLIQEARLAIAVRPPGSRANYTKPLFKIEAAIKTNPGPINRTAPVFGGSLSVPTNPKDPVVGMVNGQPVRYYYDSGMKKKVEMIKDILERVTAVSLDNPKLRDKDNVAVLRMLANQGSELYSRHLKSADLQGPLQLINNSGEYIPIDLAYTLAAPDQNSKLCEHAEIALSEGKCAGCMRASADQRNKICPFGFWSLNRVIEHHGYKTEAEGPGYFLKADPGDQDQPLSLFKNSLHGCSSRVDLANTKAKMRIKVSDTLAKACGQITIAKNWKQWEKAVPGNPSSLILIVHVDDNAETASTTIEIGTDPLDRNQLDERYIPKDKNGRAPFVILIGCSATNPEQYMYDTLAKFFDRGVTMAVSNFTTIIGDQGAEIVMLMVEIINEEAKKGKSFGEIMLKLRQQLVARGLLAGLSLLAHGDTDWQIKT